MNPAIRFLREWTEEIIAVIVMLLLLGHVCYGGTIRLESRKTFEKSLMADLWFEGDDVIAGQIWWVHNAGSTGAIALPEGIWDPEAQTLDLTGLGCASDYCGSGGIWRTGQPSWVTMTNGLVSFDVPYPGPHYPDSYPFLNEDFPVQLLSVDNDVPLLAGDSTLDGVFTSRDLTHVFKFAQYEDGIDGNSHWHFGDWNHDDDFDSGDLVTAFIAGHYEQPRPASSIPEPSYWLTSVAALTIFTHAIWIKKTKPRK